jgi:hypothetical protein
MPNSPFLVTDGDPDLDLWKRGLVRIVHGRPPTTEVDRILS